MIPSSSKGKYCLKNHLLYFYINSQEDLPEIYTCEICKAHPMYTKAGTFCCIQCKYYICLTCGEYSQLGKKDKCIQNEHPLQVLNRSNIIDLNLSYLKCRICKKYPSLKVKDEEKVFFYSCGLCHYNKTFCWECGSQIKIKSRLICKKGHPLEIFDTSLEKYNIREQYKCDACDVSGFLSTYERFACSTDIYNVCPRCKNPREKTNFITCCNDHSLIFTSDLPLNEKKEESNDLYECKICGMHNLNRKAGRYACLKCQYDICWACRKPENTQNLNTCMRNHHLKKEDYISKEEILKIYRCKKCKENASNFFVQRAPGKERCSKCHNLVFEEIIKSGIDKIFRCSLCKGFPVYVKKGIAKCNECEFHLCWNCKDISTKQNITECPKFHKLLFSIENDYKDGKFNCKECKAVELPCNIGRFTCFICKYDICISCKKPPHIKTVYCLKHHRLSYLKDKSCSANSEYYTCRYCSKEISYSIPRYGCIECTNFDVCTDCVTPVKGLYTGKPKCPKDQGGLYFTHENSGNDFGYVCDFCQKSKESCKGRRKCENCNFSICPQCLNPPECSICSVCLQVEYDTLKIKCKHNFIICKKCRKTFNNCPFCE